MRHTYTFLGGELERWWMEWETNGKLKKHFRFAHHHHLLRLTIWNWHFERFTRIHLHNRKFDPFAIIENIRCSNIFFLPLCNYRREREREYNFRFALMRRRGEKKSDWHFSCLASLKRFETERKSTRAKIAGTGNCTRY